MPRSGRSARRSRSAHRAPVRARPPAPESRVPSPESRVPSTFPDDLARIVETEIRKELKRFSEEQSLPFDLSSDDGKRRSVESEHDPSKPTLCHRLSAAARPGGRAVEFRRLVCDACALLVADGALAGPRRGRPWTLDPAWLFRQAYIRERTCGAIAAEARRPVRSVVEVLRRLSDRLERRLIIALALPPEVVADLRDGAPIGERACERVLETLRSYVSGEAADDARDEPPPRDCVTRRQNSASDTTHAR